MGLQPDVADSKVGKTSLGTSSSLAATCQNSLTDVLIGPGWGGAPQTPSLPAARLPGRGRRREHARSPCLSAETITFCKQSPGSAPLGRKSQHLLNAVAMLSSALHYELEQGLGGFPQRQLTSSDWRGGLSGSEPAQQTLFTRAVQGRGLVLSRSSAEAAGSPGPPRRSVL